MAATFLLLLTVAMAVSGAAGYLIFGPLTYRHLQDHDAHRAVGASSFAPGFFGWLLSGRYRAAGDPRLDGLATPARVLAWSFLIGALGSAILWPFATN
ncbi:MAG TPA: hypothetical protein VFO79_12295 [Xanthomonadales bacterium]|nr:hypothetical protein [Xanthomonadales bacterium]